MKRLLRWLMLILFTFGPYGVLDAHRAHGAAPIPSGCVEHTTFGGTPDYAFDYRCAGLAIDYHRGGAAFSPYPMWAGQWLFTDQSGGFRKGSCIFNRGIHPTIAGPSALATQDLPLDPSGAKSAYLTWRYGATSDDLTAAALWAVFHFYAQDAAGSNRSFVPAAPLVAGLDQVSEASGRQDVEDAAIGLDAEAQQHVDPFVMSVDVGPEGHGRVTVRSGPTPVAGIEVLVSLDRASFDDDAMMVRLTTGGDGDADFDIGGPAGDVSVTAIAQGPSSALVYRVAAVDPIAHLPQTLITEGPAAPLTAVVTITLIGPPTTSTSVVETTTTIAETTTIVAETTTTTTTTVTPTTVMAETTTIPEATTSVPTTTTPTTPLTTVPEMTTTTVAPTTAETIAAALPPVETVPPTRLPRTGRSTAAVAYPATALLVAGFGIIGAVRRRAGRERRSLRWPGDSG